MRLVVDHAQTARTKTTQPVVCCSGAQLPASLSFESERSSAASIKNRSWDPTMHAGLRGDSAAARTGEKTNVFCLLKLAGGGSLKSAKQITVDQWAAAGDV